MYDNLSFDITKLSEIVESMKKYYGEYKETVASFDLEMKALETSWGNHPKSLYTDFKEKYEEKKNKIVSVETLLKELVDTLEQKKQEIEEATIQSENQFE